jgi:beta-lactam-binding protein with PASTA domain
LFAASVGAALIPGPLGLALPLIVARQPTFGTGVSNRGTVSEVPNVIGKTEQDAKDALSERKLKPVVQSVFIQGGKNEDKGKVVDQVPKSGFAAPGTMVKLTVSLGAAPTTPEGESSVHQRIEKDVEDAQQQILVAQAQIKEAKETILKAIADTHKMGGPSSAGKQSPSA